MVSPITFRFPGPLAVSVAQVDDMSGGRAELGIGAGWFQAEHAAYGIPFPDTAERFDRLEEQLAIITGLWDTAVGERFSFAGKFYPITDSPGLPKPVQRPHPPIVIGGRGPRRTPRLAARYADEYNAQFGSVAETEAAFGRVREACQAAGRDPGTLVCSAAQTVCCGRDEAELARRAGAIGRDLAELRAEALGGTPDEIVDRIGTFAGLGATRLYLQVLDLHDLDHLELIASEVLPQVR
jgi:alkanesulfonate monooxygenase